MASLPGNGRPRGPFSKAGATALSVVMSAVLLAGCGGGGSDSPAAAGDGEGTAAAPSPAPLPPDRPQRPACGLATQAEVEAAIGARVTPGRQQNEEGRSVCSFSLAASSDQRVALVSTSSSAVPSAFDAARASIAGAQPLNAGDQAFVAGGQALLRKGTTMVAILVFLRQDPPQLASAATKLAQSVATHL
ncbi:MAG TPA: hypothetical protein VHF27_13530 [Acidimicrobiales bacterium]|nr:hypothetical protein [Acidimicrobiales bacterium]